MPTKAAAELLGRTADMRHDTARWTWKPGQYDQAAVNSLNQHTGKSLWLSSVNGEKLRFSENEHDAILLSAAEQHRIHKLCKTVSGVYANYHPALENQGEQPAMKTEAPTVQLPAIHLNGTSKTELLDQSTYASDMLRVAIDALYGAAPNARDYYVIGPDAYTRARAQHEDRIKRLTQLRSEIEQIAEGISDGGHFAAKD